MSHLREYSPTIAALCEKAWESSRGYVFPGRRAVVIEGLEEAQGEEISNNTYTAVGPARRIS